MMRAGRKEIVTFFYMYALIELLAIFLDSGIIPTASTVYPVSLLPSAHDRDVQLTLRRHAVVYRRVLRSGRGDVLLSSHQRVCRFPIRGGRNTAFLMGKEYCLIVDNYD